MPGSPGALSTGSASPVRRLSSISRPSEARMVPSTTSWSPGARTTMSSSTTSSALTWRSCPSRRTVGFASPMTASLASAREARYSWMMPMRVLATMTKPKSESWNGATMIMIAHIIPMTRLNQVRVFARMMSVRLRLRASGAWLTCPAATRSATSANVSPCLTSIMMEARPFLRRS